VVASRRVGSAVLRNRAKRLVREFFRGLQLMDPIDMVVVVKAGAHELSARDAGAELTTALATALARVRKA
jgi:ribonuclease P protein component